MYESRKHNVEQIGQVPGVSCTTICRSLGPVASDTSPRPPQPVENSP